MVMNRDVVVLSTEQFDKLVELLTPGYELAKAYLAANPPPEVVGDAADDDSRAGEGIPGTMDPGPQPTAPHVPPAADDASKGEGNPMDPGPQVFRPSSPPPSYDDPSKQGGG